MMRRILAALFLVVFSVRAMAGTITVLDGNGNPQTYQVFTNPSGNFLGSVVTCDPTSTSNCISVNASGQQTIILVPVGQPNDAAAASGSVSGSVISILKGILTNVLTPINVTGSFSVSSPLGVNIAATTPINVTVASSPLNVTGNLTANQTGQNIAQLAGQTLASPSTYGVAPVGSVQGFNGFITNQPTVVLSGSPVSVGIASSPLNVTVGNTASPAGVAVVNNVAVTTPTPLQVTLPASPISVGLAQTPINVTVGGIISPQNVTLATSPVSVAISTVSSPINVTGSLSTTPASPQNTNLVQIDGQQIASPTTYGVAPVGSVQAVNAFVTSLPATPINVTISASPMTVTGISAAAATGANTVQLAGQLLASPSTYGVAPVGSVQGVNAFVTSLPATPLNVTVAGPTPLNVTLVAIPGSPQAVTLPATPLSVVNTTQTTISLPASGVAVAWIPTVAFVGGYTVGGGGSPTLQQVGPAGNRQLGKVVCTDLGITTTKTYLQIYDAGKVTSVTLGSTLPKQVFQVPTAVGLTLVYPPPGETYANGIVLAGANTPLGTTFVNLGVCSVDYN